MRGTVREKFDVLHQLAVTVAATSRSPRWVASSEAAWVAARARPGMRVAPAR